MRLVIAISIALAACGPKPTGTHPIAGGDEAQRAALHAAVQTTEQVWRSPAFWDLVAARTWIPGPGQQPVGGIVVRAALEHHSPAAQKYRLVAFYGRRVWTVIRTSANAETAPCGTIDLIRRRVPSPGLVDTVAHENTHLVAKPGTCEGLYEDGDYTAAELPWLVSYGIGDLAQCFATSGGDPARTTQCFEQHVNADTDCRIERQCCTPNAPTNVRAARAAAPQCTATCATIAAHCAWAR